MSATEFPKDARGSSYPLFATSAGAPFNRVEPLLTPEILQKDYLWGVKLKDPVNKQELNGEDLKRAIIRATNAIELALNINILPVKRTIKIPFDRALFRSFNYMELPFKPVVSLDNLTIESADQVDQFEFPPNMLEVSNLHLGLITMGAIALSTPNGVITSAAAGAAASPLVLSTYLNVFFIPAFYKVVCTTGFPENQVPTSVNELIGVQAALDILSRVGPMFRANSTSLGQDGISQSISTAGPALYKQRTDELQLRKKELMSQIRRYFYNDFFVSNV